RVRPLAQAAGRRTLGTVERRQRLAREDQRYRFVAQLGDELPRLEDFVGVRGAQRDEPGDGAQRRKLLDRLMRRSVLANPDRVVREYVDDRQLHERAQANRWPRVVAEDEETRAEGANLRGRKTVQDGGHRMLAHTEMEVAAAPLVGRKIARAFKRQPRLGRRRQISRPSDQPRNIASERIQDLARGVAPRESLAIGGKGLEAAIPSLGQLPMLHAIQLVRERGVARAISIKPRHPIGAQPAAARADLLLEMVAHLRRYEELFVLRPAVGPL